MKNKFTEQEELIYNHLQELAKDDEVFAEKLKDAKHTKMGCINYIKSQARKQAVNGCAMIEDKVVYGWAVHYYDEDVANLESEQGEQQEEYDENQINSRRSKESPQKARSIVKTKKVAQNKEKQANEQPEQQKYIQLSIF